MNVTDWESGEIISFKVMDDDGIMGSDSIGELDIKLEDLIKGGIIPHPLLYKGKEVGKIWFKPIWIAKS